MDSRKGERKGEKGEEGEKMRQTAPQEEFSKEHQIQ